MNRIVKPVKINGLTLGDGHIYIQSMLNVSADDIEGSVKQAVELEEAGCEIVRAAIPTLDAVKLIPAIKEKINIPLVADIHFDYRIALAAAEIGIDKIRINPGNIGDIKKVASVADICNKKKIPIRIGVNSGSLEKELLAKYGSPTAEALTESALNHAKMLEECEFSDIVISIKSSNVKTMIDAYRLIAQKCSYPLHLGVTEAGTERMGLIKSSVGIGSLLLDGIGDTIRVSLTDTPIKEVYAAKDILKAIGKGSGVEIVSCPTCGRTQIDLIGLAKRVEKAVADVQKDITVAVMGCIVNGPGEAREADIGIAGGNGCGILFKKGEIIGKYPESELLSALMSEIDKL